MLLSFWGIRGHSGRMKVNYSAILYMSEVILTSSQVNVMHPYIWIRFLNCFLSQLQLFCFVFRQIFLPENTMLLLLPTFATLWSDVCSIDVLMVMICDQSWGGGSILVLQTQLATPIINHTWASTKFIRIAASGQHPILIVITQISTGNRTQIQHSLSVSRVKMGGGGNRRKNKWAFQKCRFL